MKHIALVGSTGSIGTQALNVARAYPDLFQVEALVASSSYQTFLEQIKEFLPRYAVLLNEDAAERICGEIPPSVRFLTGKEAALAACALPEADTVLVATTGFAGLRYSLEAIKRGKSLALANKETLVCGGALVMPLVEEKGIDLTPIDSEHSALWQCLNFNPHGAFRKLHITASGGPFYGWKREALAKVTAKDALKHPTWSMGAKITIDSATLLNKGFEVIEAKWLYRTSLDKIGAIVHPESIIHSMVEFDDGGILAQMSYPTMELPIQLALTYPERFDCGLKPLDFEALGAIRFLPLERKNFPCYDLALKSAEMGDNYPCVLNGAGEVAVRAFLEERISFPAIAETIQAALLQTERTKPDCYEALKATDERARALAREYIKSL